SWKCRWGSEELPELPHSARGWPAGARAAGGTRTHAPRRGGQAAGDPPPPGDHGVVAEARPMTESLRERHKRRTAEAIVASAMELFAERGFERTTIDQIAAAADISRRTFFRYFADKEELFFAEDERLLEVVEQTLDAASGAPASTRPRSSPSQ